MSASMPERTAVGKFGVWVPLLLTPALAMAQAQPAQEPSDAHSRPPPIRGNIKHQAVAEFPLPRDRTEFGIGEEVDFWIEPKDGEGPDAVIAWWVDGTATVYPVLGIRTRVTLDLTDKDSGFIVRAERRDVASAAGAASAQKPAGAADWKRWVREQLQALPQGEREPVGTSAPQARTYAKDFLADVYRIDALRNGKQTSFDKLENLGRELLANYAAPRERGPIYYWLAHVHAQGGLAHPERAAEYAQKALEHPLEPLQVPRLYVYWGDAVQIARGKEPLTTRRKHAAVIYLAGLREVIRYPLPAQAPKHRNLAVIDIVRAAGQDEQRQEAARELFEFQSAMVHHRSVLVRQIADLYHCEPAADNELRELAAVVLREPWAVDRFLRALKGAPWEPIQP